MLPLLQLKLNELPQAHEHFKGIAYLLVWCALNRHLEFHPHELQHQFLTLAMTGDEEKLAEFRREYKHELAVSRSSNPNHVRVQCLMDGDPIQHAQCEHPDNIHEARQIQLNVIDDAIENSDEQLFSLMPDDEKKQAQLLTMTRDATDEQLNRLGQNPPNHSATKIGGWPSMIQGSPEFDGESDFMLQIQSDQDAGTNMMFGDVGTIYIGRNRKTGEWVSEWSCY